MSGSCGAGLREIYEFPRDRTRAAEPAWLKQQFSEDPAPVVIVRNALDGWSELCLEALFAEGRMRPLLESMAVRVIVNDNVRLIGAARYATR